MGKLEFLWFTEPNHRYYEDIYPKFQIVFCTDLAKGVGSGLVHPGQVMVHVVANPSDSKALRTEHFLLCLSVGL